MLLAKIQESIAAYKKWLQSLRHHPHVHEWESVQHFQAHWNPEAPELAAMFRSCFFNSETRRLWHTEHWYPLKMMELFWEMDPKTVKWMFDDLYNETRGVGGRIGRFVFGCDECLRDYKSAHVGSIENNHYHGDYQMIALYLAFRYPDLYGPYNFPIFQQTLTRLGARDIPTENDLERYFKVLRTLMTFLEKDGGVVPAMQRHLQAQKHYPDKTLLLAADFCRFTVTSFEF